MACKKYWILNLNSASELFQIYEYQGAHLFYITQFINDYCQCLFCISHSSKDENLLFQKSSFDTNFMSLKWNFKLVRDKKIKRSKRKYSLPDYTFSNV